MKVWVGKNGLAHGPYAIERIQHMLQQNRLCAHDWAWSSSSDQWLRLEDFLAKEGMSIPGDPSIHAMNFGNGSVDQNNNPPSSDSIVNDPSIEGSQAGEHTMNEFSAENPRSEFPSGDIPLDQTQFGTWMLFPYVCKDLSGDKRPRFAKAVQEFDMPAGSGFKKGAPEDYLKRGQLDRWLLKEPRALFRKDGDDENDKEEVPRSPRMRWILWDKESWEYPFLVESDERIEKNEEDGKQSGSPKSYNYRLALLETKTRTVTPFPNGMQLKAFSLISNAGAIIVVIKILPPKSQKSSSISLKQAMDLNYNLAHSNNFKDIPILFPNGLLTKSKNQEIHDNGECAFSDQDIEKCLKLWPHRKARDGKERDDEIIVGEKNSNESKIVLQSFPEKLKDGIVHALAEKYEDPLDTYQASRGRTTLFTRYLLSKADSLRYHDSSIDKLEALCSRCMQHPETSDIRPLPTDQLEGEEFKTMHLTGSQRIHLSCESALSFGINLTEYSEPWQDRWGSGFLLCYMIAYHQSILCQELSWASFKKSIDSDAEDSRDLRALYNRFIEYCTHYDFSVISIQLNQQRLYRLSREVLGVPAITKEVEDEIQTRLDAQRNELQLNLNHKQQAFNDLQEKCILKQQAFNEGQVEFVEQQKKFLKSQENFNSLAVVFFLLGCSTFLLNLNLEPFNKDALIAWDFSDKYAPLESLWLWVPVGLTLILFLVPKIREHLLRVVKLLFRKD